MKKLPFLLSALLISAECVAVAPVTPKLVVSGQTVLHKNADLVSLTIGVLSQKETAQEAIVDNNVRVQQLVTNLRALGLEKGEYFTGQFSIQPIYSPAPRNPPADWKPTIIAYEVNNSLSIKTTKLEYTGAIIDCAGKAGVDQISNIVFSLADPQMYRAEAITQAAQNALRDADALATVTGVKIVRVLDIVLEQPTIQPRPGLHLYKMAQAESAPFIEAPDVDVRAHVSVTFEIAQK